MRLEQARVLLTGASGGIGRVLAKRLVEKGAVLTLTGRNLDKLQTLAGELSGLGVTPDCIAADLTDPQDVQNLVAQMTADGQRCDILINNAGQIHFGAFQDQSVESIQQMYQTNLVAPVLLIRAMLPKMLAQEGGLLVCMGSALGSIGYPFHSTASACKFGLRGFCQALRRELNGSGVRVAYVAPRTTRTSMNSDVMLDMAKALGNAVDEPETVADAVIELIERDESERTIGGPEKLFAKINALFPSIVDRALRKQHLKMQSYASKHLNVVKESDIIKKP